MSEIQFQCPPTQQRSLRAAVLVGLFAASLRVVWVLIASRLPVGLSDPFIYLHSAASIAAGDGYTSLLGHPTAYYPPGYPFFLGGVQWVLLSVGLADRLVLVVGLIQALLGGVAAGALVIAGDQLFVHKRPPSVAGRPRIGWSVGVIGGLLFACWPNLIMHAPLILSESLFVALFCVLIAALVTWTSHSSASAGKTKPLGTWQLPTLIVVSTIVCTWVRPQSILLLVPAVLVAWRLGGIGWRRTLLGIGLVVAGMVIAIVPWTIRNAIVMEHLIPMSTNSGENLCLGFHTGADGVFRMRAETPCDAEGRYVDGPDIEVALDRELRGRALRWISSHPEELPALSLKKLVATFRYENDALAAWEGYGADPHLGNGTKRKLLHATSNGYYWMLSIVAIVGLIVVGRDYWRMCRDQSVVTAVQNGVLVVAITAAGVLLPMLFFGDSRFKVPIMPCFALLAAVAIHRLLGRRKSETSSR